ncbi:glycosyltransferase family 4 protein [Hymenobacter cellulosivorans]|uniref:Glycosyltransferase family 4 protein n=1 Tax=Hymenobacter cellulosivorans TaxID=2932249 RepID=A0ABY4F4V4_9BACT|nr:glycosyltransferase family 4 protein [Hymenobacter cellulosivorans]UOQ50954.1 glycosyltransferase family 4 protein [Hymenobacter cellulosivorans]
MVSLFTPDLLTPQLEKSALQVPLVVLCRSTEWSSAEQQTLALAVALQQAGRRVLLAAAAGSFLLQQARTEHLICVALPTGLRGAQELARLIRRQLVGVLLTTRPADIGLARLLKLWRGRGLQLVHRQLDHDEVAPANPWRRWWQAHSFRAVDAWVASFPRQARQARQDAGLNPRRLWVVPPLFEPSGARDRPGRQSQARHLLRLPAPAPLIGVVAHDTQGPMFALETLYRLREELNLAAELVVIGSPATPAGPAYWAELHELARQLRLHHCVHLRPLHNSAQRTLFYQALDVLLLPSLASVMGGALLEAMASGCPLVSLAEADAPDLLEQDVTGRLFTLHNVAAATTALATALGQPAAGQRMARRAAALVAQRCGAQQQSLQLESVFQYIGRYQALV